MRNSSDLLGILVVLTLFSGAITTGSSAIAATTGTDPTDASSSVLPPSLVSLSGVQEQAMANIFSSCTGPIDASFSQMGNMAQSMLASGNSTASGSYYVGVTTDCRPVGGVPGMSSFASGGSVDPSNLRCENFMIGSTFNKKGLDSMLANLQSANSVNACKMAKAVAAQKELQCLTNSAQVLDQQMAQLQEAYTQSIQRNQTAVQQLNSIIADREAQHKDVMGKLNGEENGKPGLRKLLASSQAMIATMDQDIQQVNESVKNNQVQRGVFLTQMQDAVAGQANQCFFKNSESQYLCDSLRPGENRPDAAKLAGCPAGSACDYLLCRFWENQHLIGGQNRGMDTTVQVNADNQAKVLAGIYSQIMSDLPRLTTLPSTPDQFAGTRDQFNKFETVSQIEARYGAQLSQLDGHGVDVKGETIRILSSCFDQANFSVHAQRAQPGTSLHEAEFKIAQAERDVTRRVNEYLSKYQNQWADNMGGLTGQNLPMDVSLCRSSSPDVQVGCMQQFRGNMQGLIDGTPANGVPIGGVQMLVSGSKPQNNISFTCQGLKGCVTALENVDKNLDQETRKVKDFKQSYVLQANNSIDAFTKRVAAMLKPQMDNLDMQRKLINTSLGSLGASGIQFEMHKGAGFSKDNDGLYTMSADGESPKTIQDLIAGVSPYPDVKGNDFSGSLSSLGEAINKLEQNQQKNNQALTLASTLESQCRMKYANDTSSNAVTLATQYVDCLSRTGACTTDADKQKPLLDLIDTWNQAGGDSSSLTGASDVVSSLTYGLSCNNATTTTTVVGPNVSNQCATYAGQLKKLGGQARRSLAGFNTGALDAY